MIIAAPQLNDWGLPSARQTIALTEYLLDAYNIDETRVYANGYSGGGETMSQVMGLRPELFAGYLHCSSQWDGDLAVLAESLLDGSAPNPLKTRAKLCGCVVFLLHTAF